MNRSHRRRRSRGIMLLWVMVAVVIVLGLVFAGGEMLQASARQAEATFRGDGQALDVARAGLVDAYAWCRRQTSQPVTTFAPRRDLGASPPVNETDDPAIGLVREFEISPGYFARYEVRPFVDGNGNGRVDPGEGCADLSASRSLGAGGSVWQLESRGVVYRRLDAAQPWNAEPNRRVAGAIVTTEIRRLGVVAPGAAALCCPRGDYVTIGVRGRVEGGGAAGVVYAPGTGSAIVTGELTGTPSEGPVAGYDGSMRAVFGMTSEDLKAMSTLRLSAGERLPDPLPDFALVYHEGHLTVTQADPLMGTGILVVDGNLTIAANSNSYFTGLVYVTGDYHQQAPSLVRGVVICQGRARVLGGGDLSELVYDPSVVDQLMTQMGRYRMSRATRRLDRRGVGGPR